MTKINLPTRHYRYFPGDDPLGLHTKTIEIDTQKTALLLVDVYHAAEKEQAKHLVNTTWDQRWWQVVDNCIAPLVRFAVP
jgi:L-rhamnose mutarotase